MTRKRIVVTGEPKGKSRPRFADGHAYTPRATVDYEKRIKSEWMRQTKGFKFEGRPALALEVKAYSQPPQSESKKKRTAMLAGNLRPKKKPDFDNIAKIIGDALNGVAYADDTQIVFAAIEKYWGEPARVEITITDVEEVYP